MQKLVSKSMQDRIVFRNGLLKVKVFIEGKLRSIPIRMKKMVEEKESKGDQPFMLTSIGSEN